MRAVLVVVAVILAACGGGPTLHTLHRPAYVWFRETGLCGRSVAMDDDGVLWAEAGCENPKTRYSRIRTLSAAEREQVRAAFAALAAVTPAGVPRDCRLRHRWIVMKPDDSYPEWQACATSGTDDDPTGGLGEPFSSIVRDLPIK